MSLVPNAASPNSDLSGIKLLSRINLSWLEAPSQREKAPDQFIFDLFEPHGLVDLSDVHILDKYDFFEKEVVIFAYRLSKNVTEKITKVDIHDPRIIAQEFADGVKEPWKLEVTNPFGEIVDMYFELANKFPHAGYIPLDLLDKYSRRLIIDYVNGDINEYPNSVAA